jgi:putative ABC transport system substrate-binding protein
MSTPQLAAFGREPFHDGLRQLGYHDGKNIAVVARYADSDPRRFPVLLDELLAANVDVLFLVGPAVPIAKQKTDRVPIVCATCADPVAEGLAVSYARPGGNVTGLSWQSLELSAKRLELATEIAPGFSRLAVMFDAGDVGGTLEAKRLEEAARRIGTRVRLFAIRDGDSIHIALTAIVKDRTQVLIVSDSSLTWVHSKHIAAAATKAGMVLIAESRSFAEAGAVLTYGPNGVSMFRRAASYIDRILKGADAGELPIEQPTKFDLVVNLVTADAIGIKIPQSVLSRADEVIR